MGRAVVNKNISKIIEQFNWVKRDIAAALKDEINEYFIEYHKEQKITWSRKSESELVFACEAKTDDEVFMQEAAKEMLLGIPYELYTLIFGTNSTVFSSSEGLIIEVRH